MCLSHFDVSQKNSQELPEDSVEKRRNAPELKVISLQKKVVVNCWLIK
jgi:hypothetical protein